MWTIICGSLGCERKLTLRKKRSGQAVERQMLKAWEKRKEGKDLTQMNAVAEVPATAPTRKYFKDADSIRLEAAIGRVHLRGQSIEALEKLW